MQQLSLSRAVLLAGLLLLTAFLPKAAAQEETIVRLDPPALTLRSGETAEVRILVEGVTDLAGAEVHLAFDPSLVEVVDADSETEGVQIAHGGFLAADFVAQNQVDTAAGTIDYAVARMPPHEPASGSGELAVITLRAAAGGETALTLREVLLADPDGYPIPVEVTSDVVAVTPGSSPSSTTCWPWGAISLSVVALGLLPRVRRRHG